MKAKAPLFVAFLILLGAPSCEAQTPPPAAPTGTATPAAATIPFTSLAQGLDMRAGAAGDVVKVADEAAYLKLWEELKRGKPAPAVDFGADMVLAVFGPMKPTAGHKLAVEKVEKTGGRLVLTVREKAPPPDAVTAAVVCRAFQVVRLAKTDGVPEVVRAQ